jgi:hypothetical protein
MDREGRDTSPVRDPWDEQRISSEKQDTHPAAVSMNQITAAQSENSSVNAPLSSSLTFVYYVNNDS